MNFIVSIPRSGQHMVAAILEYIVKGHDLEYSYCEYYTCCKSFPCKKGSVFLKNHDFPHSTPRVPISPENKYLVLYRKDPILQLEAIARYHNKKTLPDMVSVMKDRRPMYDQFVEKWCRRPDHEPNILVFDYYELLASPVEHMKTVFQHFYPNVPLRPEVWENLMLQTFLVDNGRRIFVPRRIEIPRVMDPVYYQQLQDAITSEEDHKAQSTESKTTGP